MKRICLSLGANLGDAPETLRAVVTDLFVEEMITNIQVSSMYETVPVGEVVQPNFYNLAIVAETSLKPLELLDYLQGLETRYGRERTLHWGPRTLDIDIIDYEGEELQHERLTLPHPQAHLRGFVVVPLAELSSKLVLQGKTLKELLTTLDTSGVKKLEDEM